MTANPLHAPVNSAPTATQPVRKPGLQLPPSVQAAVWRGTSLAAVPVAGVATGWPALDQALPGGGWPRRSLTEILLPHTAALEWRLLGSALAQVAAQQQSIVVLGAPCTPHASGLLQQGVAADRLIRIDAASEQDRLWSAEQLIRANCGELGAVLVWLPSAQPAQIRRLQISAQQFGGSVFVFRPEAAQHDASAAPLRLLARVAADWVLNIRILKRRGPATDALLQLAVMPAVLHNWLAPRLARPSQRLVNSNPQVQAPALPPALQEGHHAQPHAVGSHAAPHQHPSHA